VAAVLRAKSKLPAAEYDRSLVWGALLLAAASAHAQQPSLPAVQLGAGMHLIRAEVADRDATRAGLRRMVALAGQLRDALNGSDLDGFGEVLHANWEQKRNLACGITNPTLDGWYDTARAQGAIGGKVLGAGGGGFLLFYAPVERHTAICAALPTLRRVTFHLEPQGSRLIYIEDNGYAG